MPDYTKEMSFRLFLFTLTLVRSVPASPALRANIGLNVDGDGFHRQLIYRLDIEELEQTDCQVALHLELPAALYVNVDELADLRRSGDTVACSTGESDVELFTEKAGSQEVTVCTPLSNETAFLRFPIHQRYQYAKSGGGYNTVTLLRPRLLVGCPDRIKEYRISKVNLCAPCVHTSAKWREIPYEMDQEDCIWLVPVGDSSLLTFISYVTLFITIIGAIFITKTIAKAVPKEEEKKD